MGAEPPEVGPTAPGPAVDGPPSGQPVALDLRDHVLFDTDAPRAQPITSGGDLSLQLICLEPKQSLPATTLDADRLYTVIGGRAWTVIDDAEIRLEPLQAVLVPAGAAHGLRNDSADPLILQVIDGAGGDAGGALQPRPAAAAEPAPRPDSEVPQSAPRPVPSTPERDRFARIRKLLGSGD